MERCSFKFQGARCLSQQGHAGSHELRARDLGAPVMLGQPLMGGGPPVVLDLALVDNQAVDMVNHVTDPVVVEFAEVGLVERWKLASGLVDGRGDPDGVTPEAAQRHWEGVEAQLVDLQRTTTERLDRLATLFGCPEWDYPGQIERDAAAVGERLDDRHVQVLELRDELADARARIELLERDLIADSAVAKLGGDS